MAERALKPGYLPQRHGPVEVSLARAFFDEESGRSLAGVELIISSAVFLARRVGLLKTLSCLRGSTKPMIYLELFC